MAIIKRIMLAAAKIFFCLDLKKLPLLRTYPIKNVNIDIPKSKERETILNLGSANNIKILPIKRNIFRKFLLKLKVLNTITMAKKNNQKYKS